MRAPGVLLAACALTAGCAPPLEQVWQLRDFRVLGARVEPPEPARGEAFTLELVSADVRERPVQVAWFVCALAASATAGGDAGAGAGDGGGLGGCPASATQLGFGSPARFTVPATGGAPDLGGRETLTVIAYACAGGTIGAPAAGGTQPTCTGADARGWLFTRTVAVRGSMSPNPPNANPAIAEVRFGPQGSLRAITPEEPPRAPRCARASGLDPCPGLRFEVAFTPDSRQTYRGFDPEARALVERMERLTTGYVVDRGTLAGGFRTDSNAEPMATMNVVYTPPAEPGPVNLFVYAQDGRGGFTWTRRTLIIE